MFAPIFSIEQTAHPTELIELNSRKSPIDVSFERWHWGFGAPCFVGSNPVNVFTGTAILIPLVISWFLGKLRGKPFVFSAGNSLSKKRWEGMQFKTMTLVTRCSSASYKCCGLHKHGDERVKSPRVVLCRLFTSFLPQKLEPLGAKLRFAMGWVAHANRFDKDMGYQWISLLKMGGLPNRHLHFWMLIHDSLYSPSSIRFLHKCEISSVVAKL